MFAIGAHVAPPSVELSHLVTLPVFPVILIEALPVLHATADAGKSLQPLMD